MINDMMTCVEVDKLTFRAAVCDGRPKHVTEASLADERYLFVRDHHAAGPLVGYRVNSDHGWSAFFLR